MEVTLHLPPLEVFLLANLLGGLVAMKAWKWNYRVVGWCWLSAVTLALLVPFVLFHEGNTTSLELWWLTVIFLPAAIVGLRALMVFEFRWVFLVAVLLGFVGMSSLVYIDQTNSLISYMTWIKRGAPTPG